MDIQTLSDLELISLHKAIHDKIQKLAHDLKWYERMSEKNSDYIPKYSICETEYNILISIRKLTSEELTLRNYRVENTKK